MISIIATLAEHATRQPDGLALIQGEQRVSFGELWSRIVTAACHLADSGVRTGDRVMLDAPSQLAFPYGYFATHLLGAVAVSLDPGMQPARRDELVERTRPVLAFRIGGAATGTCPVRPLEELAALPPRKRDFPLPALDLLSDLIFTTGTTGRPKGVRLTHRNTAATARQINAVFGTRPGDIDVVPIPLYHGFGLGRMRCVLTAGGAVLLAQGFRLPGEIFAAIQRHNCTGLVGVPAGFAVLLQFGERGLGTVADKLRYIELGSAVMPLEQKLALIKLLPNTKLLMHYGLTEAGRSSFTEFHRDRNRLDTVGLPAPGVQFEVRDDQGKPLPAGTPGALWVGGEHVSAGYWEDPETTARTFVDGWMRTGDVAHLDAEGFIFLHGRTDDLMNIGGAKVSPDEIENVLCAHAAVQEAACIGVPDPRKITGEAIRAYLVAREGQPPVAEAELRQWVGERLEPYKVPVQYEWTQALPRTASGKLMRRILRDGSGKK